MLYSKTHKRKIVAVKRTSLILQPRKRLRRKRGRRRRGLLRRSVARERCSRGSSARLIRERQRRWSMAITSCYFLLILFLRPASSSTRLPAIAKDLFLHLVYLLSSSQVLVSIRSHSAKCFFSGLRWAVLFRDVYSSDSFIAMKIGII